MTTLRETIDVVRETVAIVLFSCAMVAAVAIGAMLYAMGGLWL